MRGGCVAWELTEDTRDMYGGTKADAAAKSATTSSLESISVFIISTPMGPGAKAEMRR